MVPAIDPINALAAKYSSLEGTACSCWSMHHRSPSSFTYCFRVALVVVMATVVVVVVVGIPLQVAGGEIKCQIWKNMEGFTRNVAR